MKMLLLTSLLILSCNPSFAQEDEVEVAPQESAPRVRPSPSEAIDPEKAKDMMDKLRAGQNNREDQNKFLEELDAED
jgi:hypothetical protein